MRCFDSGTRIQDDAMPLLKTRFIHAVLVFLVLGACASAPVSRTTYADDDYRDSSFENFLVIGVAGSYNNRAEFERQVVSGLRSEGADASAFYNLAGNEPISRDGVLAAVESNAFDAVVVTRVQGRQSQVDVSEGSSGAKASTIGGRPINFFRYNYEELNEPDNLDFSMSVTLVTEVFTASEEKLILSFETSTSQVENIGALINATAQSVVRRLAAEGLVGS